MSTILVIDDDEMTLMMLHNLLADVGYSMLSTADGPQGLSMFKERHPDLVLLDLGLPSMDGLRVLEELREFDPEAKIIIITGYASPQATSEAMRRGAIDLAVKPLDPRALLEMIKNVLGPKMS